MKKPLKHMKHKNGFLFKRCLTAIVVLLLFCVVSTTPAQTTLPAEDIAEKALAATVYLEMTDKNGKILGFGSGFFVRSNLIATNYHVIEGAAKGTARLVNKETRYKVEGITATDKTNDLALLKVSASGIKPLSFSNSDEVKTGAKVYVTGNPKREEGTFSDGIISSRRDKQTRNERMQMTAPISKGSSGGPVLNKKGEVIGVSVAHYEPWVAQNLNFAIPSKYLKELLEQSKPEKPNFPKKSSISAETRLQWGNVKFQLGDYADAIEDYTIAIRLKPDYADAYLNRGATKAILGQNLAAIVDYDKAIHFKPDYADAYSLRGNVKFQLGDYADAIEDYTIAIRLKPDYADAYSLRGLVKAALGKYLDAIADYDKAIHLKPDDAIVYLHRGFAKADLGRTQEAKQDFRTALRLAIKNGNVLLQNVAEDMLGR